MTRSWFRIGASLALISCAAAMGGCATIAVATAPEKAHVRDDSPGAKQADAAFWDALHGGRYEDIDTVVDGLQAVYLAHPNDARTAAHIGFLHMWRISERARIDRTRPTITDDMTLARRYFEESFKLDPTDARVHGFLAGATMSEGTIHHDEKLTRRGYFEMRTAVDAWPEFNLFTRGYSLSRLPFDSERYAAALDDQWDLLDRCAGGTRVDRKSANFAPFMHLETHEGKKRACWNSWIAPHNFEGFFLSMGDMVVKAGDPQTARNVYAQAKLSKDYATWPYRDVLERRVAQAEENVARFRAAEASETAHEKERRMMIDSAFSCSGCHRR